MLASRAGLLFVAVLTVSACQDASTATNREPDDQPTEDDSPTGDELDDEGTAARPSFPDDPATMVDFREGSGDWDPPGATSEEGLLLRTEGAALLTASPVPVTPPGRATYTEVVFGDVSGTGTYGAYCRGDGRTRYQLTLSTEGRLAMQRVSPEGTVELSGDKGREYPRPDPALVSLICLEEADGLRFVVSLDALGFFEVTDPDPLPLPPDAGTGVVADGDLEITVVGASVWLAE